MSAKSRGVLIVMLVGGLSGAVVGVTSQVGKPLLAPDTLGLLTAGIVALAGFASLPVWRLYDEVARDAHKTAWTHGATFGLAPVAGLFVWAYEAGDRFPAQTLHLGPGAGGLVAFGIAATFICQVVGYGLVWAGWWLSKR